MDELGGKLELWESVVVTAGPWKGQVGRVIQRYEPIGTDWLHVRVMVEYRYPVPVDIRMGVYDIRNVERA